MTDTVIRTRSATSLALERTLKPSSVAFVGLSDEGPFADLVRPTVDAVDEVHFVHPKRDRVLGRPTAPNLTAAGRRIDAVMSFVSAERTTELVEEAAHLDVGGLVLVAGGFAEIGADGDGLQRRIRRAAHEAGMAVIGPNGLGFVNVPHGVHLTIAGRHRRRPGGISIVSQSGSVLSGVAMAAWQHSGCGLNVIVSAGNEAVTDLADYVDYFADDPQTAAIGLVVEQVRRPKEFFAAVRRAAEAGKPAVVLKLARSERTRRMATSHTGALAEDAWVYDVALRQAGVALAYDPEELVDRLALFEQVPREKWTPVRGLGVVTMTGGSAALSLDIATVEGVPIPPLESFRPWVREHIPGGAEANPLDTPGSAARHWPEIVTKYATSDELDALMMIHPLADEDEDTGKPTVATFLETAASIDKPFLVANCSGVPGAWLAPMAAGVAALGRGVRPSLRGLQTLGAFVRYRERLKTPGPQPVPAIARPAAAPIPQPEGDMLPFAATMRLLAGHGVPVAPYLTVPADHDASSVKAPFAGPYVVKLADVAHRTEHDAVRLDVGAEALPAAVRDLRALATAAGLPDTVAIQPMIAATGEALLGIQGGSELGPLVVFGLGGVFAEALGRVGGRMAPLSVEQARELIEEFRDVKVMHGFRGRAPWDLDALAGILLAAGRLAAGGADWIASLDVNPLLYGPGGFQAVDALLLLRPHI